MFFALSLIKVSGIKVKLNLFSLYVLNLCSYKCRNELHALFLVLSFQSSGRCLVSRHVLLVQQSQV